jgi:hypothetical protein
MTANALEDNKARPENFRADMIREASGFPTSLKINRFEFNGGELMRKTLLLAVLATCCAIVFSSNVAFAADNWLGTWKLNVAKSKFNPGPGPQGRTLKFESTADGIQQSADTMTSDGSPMHGGYLTRYDGVDVPWTGNPDADIASAKKIDDNSYVNTWKKDGKTTIVAKAVVSKDGKTLTVTQTGVNAKGQKVKNVEVYERQ